MKCIALDDEPLALALIAKLLSNIEGVQLEASFTDALTALKYLETHQIDLILSDIHMPEMSGLEVALALRKADVMVIFITAHKEFALDGFDLDVVDYLVKPLTSVRFEKAMAKALALYSLQQQEAELVRADAFILVYAEYKQVRVLLKDVLYIESLGDYVKIHLTTQRQAILTLQRIKDLSSQLSKHGFRRIHRSYLVNMAQVTAQQKSQVQVAGQWLPVGRAHFWSE
jgi:two-component system, LytTR family, response regulator